MAFPFPDTAMTGDCLNCLHVLHIYLRVHQTCTSRWMYNTDGMHTIYDLWSATISPTHRNGTAHTSNMAPGMQCGLHLAHILTFYMASWHSILAYYWTSYLTYRPTIAIWHKFWHEKKASYLTYILTYSDILSDIIQTLYPKHALTIPVWIK